MQPIARSTIMNDHPFKQSCTVPAEKTNYFDFLTDTQKLLVDKNQRSVSFNKGEIITKQGTFSSHIIFMESGLVKMYHERGEETLILKILGPGSIIGLSALQRNENIFYFTTRAYIDTSVRLLDINLFQQLLNENGRFASHILHFMSEHTNQLYHRFFGMTHHQSFGKLADLILCLSEGIFKSSKFILFLTRKELAEIAGLSTENVIRILKKFQDDKLIRISGKTLEILDTKNLRRISDIG